MSFVRVVVLSMMGGVACGHSSASAPQPASGTGGGAGGSSRDASPPLPPGGVNCGLPAPAFCDTFDAPSATRGRAGDLDPAKWSGARFTPLLPTGNGNAFAVGMATIPGCRAGVPTQVFPDDDTLICDPIPTLESNHLLVATAVQNYGVNSYRIRQPFDFAGREGTIVFDADASTSAGIPLMAWISVEVTEDPIGVPSFAEASNYEGGVVPKNGFELQFNSSCGGDMPPKNFSLFELHEFANYVDTVQKPKSETCVAIQSGAVNHFEVHVSQNKIDVYATPASPEGRTFDAPKLLMSAAVNLMFSRGYVHVSTRNHATIKYSPEHKINAAVARWDNVGFDGPVVTGWREYEVPDSLTTGNDPNDDPQNPGHMAKNIGYLVADESKGSTAKVHFVGVDAGGAKNARLALTSWYLQDGSYPFNAYTLKYRFNAGAWRTRGLTPGEVTVMTKPSVIVSGAPSSSAGVLGGLGQMIDVAVADLVAGDNTLEFVTTGVPQNYPSGVVNVDLILTTE